MKLNINLPSGHIKELDGVRGLAIALVLLFHCFSTPPLDRFTTLGWTGVDLFFVLSGFLITGILWDTKSKPHYYRNFISKRALRIFPLYYFSLAAFFILNSRYKFASSQLEDAQVYFWTYTQNFYFALRGWLASDANTLNHFWSLAQEEQFYLFWPIAVFYLSRRRLVQLAVLGILCSLIIRNLWPQNPFSYVFFFARFDSMLIGGLAAVLIREKREWLDKIVSPIALFSLAFLVVGLFITKKAEPDSIFLIRAGYTVFDLFYGCLILMTLDVGPAGHVLKKFFRVTPLTFLGKYSYGIYVYHWIFVNTLFTKYFVWPGLTTHHTVNVFLAACAFSLLIVALSFASYHLMEVRFLDMKKRFDTNTPCLEPGKFAQK